MKNIETYINPDGKLACATCGTLVNSSTIDMSAPCQACVAHAAKVEQRLASQRATAAILSRSLKGISRIQTPKGWRFEATLDTGETFVVRALATRPYTTAAIHDLGVVSKFEMLDSRSFITLHNAAPKPAGNWDKILRVLPVSA